jgi:cytoskeletal protein RodZ
MAAAAFRRAAQGGLRLAEARARRGVTLREISDATKISLRFLEAIEAEEFEKLPGGVFAVSYLKQYAAAIGYPEQDLVEAGRTRLGLAREAAGSVKDERRLSSFLGLPLF